MSVLLRKNHLFIIVLSILVGLNACRSDAKNRSSEGKEKLVGEKVLLTTKPDQIGWQVFHIIKSIDYEHEEGNKQFAKLFLTYAEAMNMGEDEQVTKNGGLKESLATMTEEEWTQTLDDMYIDVLSWMFLHGIDLKEITRKDFTHKVTDLGEDGKFVDGSLTVAYKGKEYDFSTFSIWNGKEYVLIRFETPVNEEADKGNTSSNVTNKPTDPKKDAMMEQIAQDVLLLLKQLDDIDKQTFMKSFLTHEALNELGKNKTITSDEGMNKKFLVSEEEYEDFFSPLYEMMKEKGDMLDIVWKDIAYSDFSYKVFEDKSGGEFATGELIIAHGGEKYTINVYTFWDGEQYLFYSFD